MDLRDALIDWDDPNDEGSNANRRSETMKPTMKPERTAEQRAEEEAVRRQHAANPVRRRPGGAINSKSLVAILSLVARFKTVRESQGLTLAQVADQMGI